MGLKYFVRPECGVDNRWGPTLGPFADYVQLTYKSLRVGPDGDEIACWVDGDGWLFLENYWSSKANPIPIHAPPPNWTKLTKVWHEYWWSDVVIWAEENN